MKSRVMTSLALPAALATAGLLGTAEAAYAAVAPDTQTGTATYGYPGQPISGDVTLTPGTTHPCAPIGNVTITDYGHCCPPVNNMTITDYGHCCNVGNVTIPDYGFCKVDHDHGREHGFGHHHEYADDAYAPQRGEHEHEHEHGFGHHHEYADDAYAPQRGEHEHEHEHEHGFGHHHEYADDAYAPQREEHEHS